MVIDRINNKCNDAIKLINCLPNYHIPKCKKRVYERPPRKAHNRILSDSDIEHIKNQPQFPGIQIKLAEKFGVSFHTIRNIRCN